MLQDYKITAFEKTHAMLADDPSLTMSAAQLKAWWDSAPEELRAAFNNVIDTLASALVGQSGAEQVGSAPIQGVNGATAYAQLVDLKAQISAVIGGSLPPGGIQTSMLQDLAVTAAKLAQGSVTLDKLDPTAINALNADNTRQDREIAQLKLISSIKNRVDNSSYIFYDDFSGSSAGSIGVIDQSKGNASATLAAGATSATIINLQGTFLPGEEVTIQDIVSEAVRERKIVQSFAGGVLTFTSALMSTFTPNAKIYRSLATARTNTKTLHFDQALNPTFDSLLKLADPATMPTGAGADVAFSQDRTYLAVAHATSPFISIYKRSGDTFTKLANPATLPSGAGQSVAFSADGTYLAVGYTGSSGLIIYKRSGDTFTKLTDPATMPVNGPTGLMFSQDGQYLAASNIGVAPMLNIYRRSGDVFLRLPDPVGISANAAYSVAFSPDSVYLAVGVTTSTFITLYKREGDAFTRLPDPASLPAGQVNGAKFSADGQYLALSHNTTPFVTIYKCDGDTFTKLGNPATLPAGNGTAVSFSPDGYYLSVSHATTPFITTYRRSGDTFTKLNNPATLPPGNGDGVAISDDGKYVAVGAATTPFLMIYKSATGIDVLQTDIRYSISPASNADSIVAWVDRDDALDISAAASVVGNAANENFVALTETTASLRTGVKEDQFIGDFAANPKVSLRLTVNRPSVTEDKIYQITGAVGGG